MKRTILIDGFNLGLEQGTGIATYSRNLSYALHAVSYTHLTLPTILRV